MLWLKPPNARVQVCNFFHAFLEFGGFKLRARIAAGFVQFADNVGDGGYPKLFIGVLSRF